MGPEAKIEAYLVKQTKRLGGEAAKFTSPSHRSRPDRIVMLPGGVLFFVELKAPKRKPTDAQVREHNRLRALGQRVEIIDSIESVDRLLIDQLLKGA